MAKKTQLFGRASLYKFDWAPYHKRMGRLQRKFRFLSILLFAGVMGVGFGLLGCASKPQLGMEDYDADSQAAGAAYVVDAMRIRRPMPSRPDWKPMEFYYKHCEPAGQHPHYSKTAYQCSDPY